jgi:hypothetical protein
VQFRNSLKHARDTFDPYVENSRQGWYQKDELPPLFQAVFDRWKGQSVEEIWSHISSFTTSSE